MIHFHSVTKRYEGGQEALKELSFELDKGEMAFLTGHSGAGKSTLLKLLMLMDRPTSGRIIYEGRDLASIAPRNIPYHRRNIGVVFQNHSLLFDRTVFDNVAMPLLVSGHPYQETGRRVRAALDRVGLLSKEQKFPVALSTGEQQRVGIARAVVHKPALLLADEPTGNLDPELSAGIMKLFSDFNAVGVTMLIATHDIRLIRRMDKREIILSKGHLIDQ